MEKEFIPYEEALELKELGFNEECLDKYIPTSQKLSSDMETWGEFYPESAMIPAPLYQQAFRWFRDENLSNCYIYHYQDRTDGSINFGYSITHNYGIEEIRFIKENYMTYECAELACLKKLIEIIKSK
jgi:hypothetical protein